MDDILRGQENTWNLCSMVLQKDVNNMLDGQTHKYGNGEDNGVKMYYNKGYTKEEE